MSLLTLFNLLMLSLAGPPLGALLALALLTLAFGAAFYVVAAPFVLLSWVHRKVCDLIPNEFN